VPFDGHDCCCELDADWPEKSHQWFGPLGGWVPAWLASLLLYRIIGELALIPLA